jgi:hypothetical protein
MFPVPMDLFKPIIEAGERMKALGGGGAPGDGSKTLEAESAASALPAGADQALPSSGDAAMLTDAARAVLGVGSGGSSSDEQAVSATQGAPEGDGGEET